MSNNNSIDSLKSVISKRGGVAFQNRFKIEITPPTKVSGDTRDFTILCESCTLPSRQILTADYQSIRQNQKIANGYINDEVTFNFILTNDYIVRKLFDQWSGLVINFNVVRDASLSLADIDCDDASDGLTILDIVDSAAARARDG